MYKINNSKTTVKEVFLENRPTTNGDHYHVCYREGGNTTSKTAGTTAAFKPGSLEQVEEDHFKARMTNGDVCHFYVTKNSVTYNNESFRFSKQGANEEEEEKKEKNRASDANLLILMRSHVASNCCLLSYLYCQFGGL